MIAAGVPTGGDSPMHSEPKTVVTRAATTTDQTSTLQLHFSFAPPSHSPSSTIPRSTDRKKTRHSSILTRGTDVLRYPPRSAILGAAKPGTETMTVRVGLMGFGRIGRNVFRLMHERTDQEIAAVADVADPAALAYLLKYDSLFGRFPSSVELADERLIVGGRAIPFLNIENPGDADWAGLGVDVVVQATGRHKSATWCRRHLEAGAKYVVLASTPDKPSDLLIVLWGINDRLVDADHPIVALGSNTSNALAPILQILDDSFGIERAFFTTIHAFTNHQRLADVPSGQFRGSRAAGENIIPSDTNSAQILEQVLPHLSGKLSAMALNVPVPDGSNIDLVTVVRTPTTKDNVNMAVREAVATWFREIIEYADDPIVSSDVTGTQSGIFDSLATMVLDQTMIKTVTWFDNGWGYAARVVDTIARYGALIEVSV